MALNFAGDKEKQLLTQLRTVNPKVTDTIRESWATINRSGRDKGFFQVEDSGVRYMFLLRIESADTAHITLIAQQERFGYKREFQDLEKVF